MATPSAPATKAARQARIAAILAMEQVHSQEQLAGPSITPAVISSPRCAGRQCSTIAPSAASASSSPPIWNGASASRRAGASCWPIETQTSVASTSAPLTARAGSSTTAADPPVSAAIRCAAATIPGSGW